MGFLGLLAATAFLAVEVTRRYGGEKTPAYERVALAFLLGGSFLIGTNWVLALTGLLCAGALWVCSGVFLAAGLGFRFLNTGGQLRWARPSLPVDPLKRAVIALLSLVVAYVFIRGMVLNVWEFDALSYHFPKAVELLRGHGIHFIPSNDFRIPYFPWNYEFLLADGLALTPGDGLTHLIEMLSAFGFGAYTYAIFCKAWPDSHSDTPLLGVMLACAMPILILQLGAYKNDILFAMFLLSTIYWSCLWVIQGGGRELAFAFLSLSLAFGTKATALFMLPAAGLALVLGRRHLVGVERRAILKAIAFVIPTLLLTGAAWPLFNKVWCGHLLGMTAVVGGVDGFQSDAVPHYSALSYLWKFPVLVFWKPFSKMPDGVWAFWEHRYLWWPDYQILYSHFGWLCTILLSVIPFGWKRHRSVDGTGRAFRIAVTVAILAYSFLVLPQRYRVDGFFCAFARSLLCVPVLVVLWSALPLIEWLRSKGKNTLVTIASVGILAYFSGQAFVYLKNDQSKSFNEFTGALLSGKSYRANALVAFMDHNAGPEDSIAYDSGFGGFFYPLYGPGLKRPLHFLQVRTTPVFIPPDAKWVVIDRSWNSDWSHPGVLSTGDFWKPWVSAPSAEDLIVVNQMLKDPRFVLVFANPGSAQAVFLRRPTNAIDSPGAK